MLEMGTSGLMSGAGKRGGAVASALAPSLDSTEEGQQAEERDWCGTERRRGDSEKPVISSEDAGA